MSEAKNKKTAAVLILVFSLLTLLIRHLTPARGLLILSHYTMPLIFAFTGAVIMRKKKIRADYIVCASMLGWYVLSRIALGENYLDNSWEPFCRVAVCYLLAFPFAFGTDDVKKKTGLKWVAGIYFVAMFAAAAMGLLAAVLGDMIVLPTFENGIFGITAGWERRLHVMGHHPNISAAQFLIALMLGFWLLCTLKKRWLILPWFIMSLTLYTAIGLTVSRTVMIQTSLCVAFAGVAFVMHSKISQKQLKVVACIAVAAALFFGCYFSFNLTNSLTQAVSDSIPVAEAEQMSEDFVTKRSLLRDATTLTGRTEIYRRVLQMFKDNPKTLFLGDLEEHSLTLLINETGMGLSHTHNAYLEVILFTGLPGALIAIYLTIRALWLSFKVVFLQNSIFTEKLLAAFVVTLLISAIPEVYLFSNFEPLYNFLFFLIFGYLVETERALRA